MYEKFTSKDAERTFLEYEEKRFDQIMFGILHQVKEAAQKGNRFLKVQDYGFGDDSCDSMYLMDWPNVCRKVFQELNELGYKCEQIMTKNCAGQKQSSWLEITW